MRLYNSKTNQTEPFISLKPGEVSMYVCGPTVYGDAHIGNARPIIVFDTLRRTLEALGYTVRYISNYTDVDDKIIQKALSEGVDETVITARYIAAYQAVRDLLNCEPLAKAPKVTETIPQIIAFIQRLVDNGFAYNVDGNVYFRVSRSETYGEISKQKVDDLMVGARIEKDSEKENPLDFALWKKTETGIQWDSPWGNGRPGWHTECVVMIEDHFHGLIDIHGGGMDLKFPHHENEVAQAHACYAHGLANYWIHNGMLNIDGEKMSKSLGNVLLAKDMLALLGGNVLRWMMLSAHYRAPLNINEAVTETAKTEIQKAETILKQVEIKAQLNGHSLEGGLDETLYPQFLEAMEDDLNTPNAMKSVFDTIKALNASLRQREWSPNTATLYVTLRKMLHNLGVMIEPVVLSETDRGLFEQWNQAKAAKDFALADQLRQQLSDAKLLV